MKQFGFKEALVLLMLSGVLAGLYLQSRQTGSETLYHITRLIHEIVSVDTSMERDVLRLKIGALQHYDSVAQGGHTLDRSMDDLRPHVAFIPEMKAHLRALENSVQTQRNALEVFKRNNSLIRNSLRYFPVAINDAVSDDPEQFPLLSHIHNDLLQSMAVPENMSLDHLRGYVDELRQSGQPVLSKHLNEIIIRYSLAEKSIGDVIHCGIDENGKALMLAYEKYHEKQLQRSEKYRVALTIYSAFLLILIVVAMYRLQQTVSKLKEANTELQYQKFALDEHAIVAVTDHMGNITYANQRFVDISGYSRDELIGQNHRILKSGYHPKEFYQQMWDTITSGKTWHGEIKNRVKNGRAYWWMRPLYRS